MDYYSSSQRFSFAAQWTVGRLKWTGSTTYDPMEGIVLDLHRHPSKTQYWPPRNSEGSRVTVGVGVDRTLYTAFQSFVSDGPTTYVSDSPSRGQTCKVFANHLLKGASVSSANRREFTKLRIASPSLLRWSAVNNIKVSRSRTQSPIVSATYTTPQELEFEIDKVGTAKIRWYCSEPGMMRPSGRVEIAERVWLEISFSRPWSFAELQNLAYSLSHYFSFAVNDFSHRTDFAVRLGSNDTRPSQLFLRQLVSTERQSIDCRPYFTLRQLNGEVAASMSQWVQKYHACENALGAYFTTRLQRPDVHLRFLYMAQCVEALSRSMFRLQEPTPTESENLTTALRKAYKDATLIEFRRLYSDRIGNFRNLGTPTFIERLKDLPFRYPLEFKAICPGFANLASTIRTWRNNITHRNPMQPVSQETISELDLLTDALRFAAELMIMEMMRIPSDVRKKALAADYTHELYDFGRHLGTEPKRKSRGKRRR